MAQPLKSGPAYFLVFGIGIACLTAYFSLGVTHALADYDSSACSEDAAGMIYMTLGNTTLKFPQEAPMIMSEVHEPVSTQSNSEEAAQDSPGCPGNPILVKKVSFAYAYQAVLTNKLAPKLPAGMPSQLHLIVVDPSFWGLQPSEEQRFLTTCYRHGVRSSDDSMEQCRTFKFDPNLSTQRGAALYRVHPHIYVAPFSRPFIIDCMLAVTLRECMVHYKLKESLNVFYRFYERDLPIAEVVNFDKNLRAMIESAIVLDQPSE